MHLTKEILEDTFEELFGERQIICGHCGKKLFCIECHECLGEINASNTV